MMHAMARGYARAREMLDDIVALAKLTLTRAATANDADAARVLAAADSATIALREHVGARVEATGELARLPFEQLARTFQLTDTERRCLGLLVAIEVASEVRVHVAGGAATLELLDRLIYDDRRVREQAAIELGARGRLWTYSLVEWADEKSDLGRLHRPLRVSQRVVELALGTRDLAEDVATVAVLDLEPAAHDELLLPEGLRDALIAALRVSGAAVPVIRGAVGSGRRSIACSAAHALGAPLLIVRCDDLPAGKGLVPLLVAAQREALLFNAVTLLHGIEALAASAERGLPDRTKIVDRLYASFPGPLIATAARDLSFASFESRGVLAIDLPSLDEAQRAELWRRELGGGSNDDLAAAAAARYRVTGGTIKLVAQIARRRGELRNDSPVLADIQAGVRGVMDDKLSALATRIEWQQSWDDLVLPDDSRDELREMIARVRYRRTVLDDWGFARKVAKGVGMPALFYGPPGTGKTMAAGLVAAELGMDLYQVDLSRMVSKYVGETEKQLAQVFDAAETGHAILLFDEADSLFAKRTDVRTATDRYANLEVNYLLQRMEAFSGIAILTTNLDTAIDEAFRRRLAFRIAFPQPEIEERGRLWRRMIPELVPTTGSPIRDR
jgi:hypothetical protein